MSAAYERLQKPRSLLDHFMDGSFEFGSWELLVSPRIHSECSVNKWQQYLRQVSKYVLRGEQARRAEGS